ncbi:hypothetical protein BHM03_00037847 [Ensete ventricosum]|nr:hypothetical protein BHM03_00037847 [Ensete ventricosum]
MLKDHKLKLRPNFRQSGNLRYSCGKSFDLLPVISRRAPSELPDPFDESPSELSTRSHCIVQTRVLLPLALRVIVSNITLDVSSATTSCRCRIESFGVLRQFIVPPLLAENTNFTLVLFAAVLLMSGFNSLRASLHLQPTCGCLGQGSGFPHLA